MFLLGNNLLSAQNVSITLPVQTKIENFTIHDIDPIPYGTNYTVLNLTVSAGTFINVTVTFGNTTLQTAYIDDNGTGLAIVHDFNYYGYGYYEVQGTAGNLISEGQNFTLGVWVDYPITNLSVTVDKLFLKVDEAMTVLIGMYWCSRFNVTINYGDNSSVNTYYDLVQSPDNITIHHSYSSPGVYPMILEIDNPVDYFTVSYTIVVQYPVLNLDSSSKTPNVLQYGTPVEVPLNLTFLGGVEPATDAVITVNYFDGSVSVDPFNVNDSDPILFSMWHSYSAAGTYNISINVSNLVSWITLYELVDVDECIFDLELNAVPIYVITNEYADLQVTMAAGTRATCNWFFDDGTANAVGNCSRFGLTSMSHQFTAVGLYFVHVFAKNTVNFQSASPITGPVIVQNPVVGFSMVCLNKVSYIGPGYTVDYSVEINFELRFDNREVMATNASYEVDFGDGYVSTAELLPTTMQATNHAPNHDLVLKFSHIYTRGNNYSIDITIWNLVSVVTYSDTFDIYEAISNLQVIIYDYNYLTNVKKLGGGPNRDHFALENEVWFQAIYDRGSHITFDWMYNDSSSDSIYYQNYALHQFDETGMYYIELQASNIISTFSYTAVVYMDRSCINISISGNTPRPKNTTFDFPVYPGNIATDACYMIDFGDDTSIPGRYQFFGDYSYCASIPEWSTLFTENEVFYIPLSSDDWEARKVYWETLTSTTKSTTTVSTTSTSEAPTSSTSTTSTTTSTTSVSTVSSLSTSTPSTVSKTPAALSSTTTMMMMATTAYISPESTARWNETIRTKYMTPGLYDTTLTCKNMVSEESTSWKTGVTKGPCWWPYVNVTSANPCKPPFCDSDDPTMRISYRSEKLVVYSDVIINCTATKIAYYWWRVYKQNLDWGNETEITDLKEADVYSIGARNLILEGNTLEYGLYRFWLNASMDEVMGMYTTDSIYLRIIPTPLVANIAGGEFILRRWGDIVPVHIDGGSFSFDPDMEDPNDKTGMEFIWLCRRLCESWPVQFTKNYNVKKKMPPNNCTYQDPQDRGCNKIDGFDSSGEYLNFYCLLLTC